MQSNLNIKYLKTALPLLFLVSACNYSHPKDSGTVPNGALQAKPAYADINTKIFARYCTTCHSPTAAAPHQPFLDSYEKIVANIAKIQSDIASGRMPDQRPPLSKAESDYVNNWVAQGMPETATTPPQGPAPTTQPPSDPNGPVPTFARVNAEVFQLRCVKCHSATAVAPNKPTKPYLTSFVLIAANLADIKADAVDSNDMPQDAPLTADQKAALAAWITGGAKDDGSTTAQAPSPGPTPARTLSEVMDDMGTEFKLITAQAGDASKNQETLIHVTRFAAAVGEASNLIPTKLGDGAGAQNEASLLEYKKMIAELDQLTQALKDQLLASDNAGAQASVAKITDLKVQGHKVFK